MNKYLALFIIQYSLFIIPSFGQNKSGNAFVFGGGGIVAKFDNSFQISTHKQFNSTYYISFDKSSSNICDSATGKLLMICNGYVLYDTIGNIIENGDSLVPSKIYNHNPYPDGQGSQGSLILPKGNNGLFYIFTPTTTDSNYDLVINQTNGMFTSVFDLFQYHIVDMNASNGLGKIVQKNIPILKNVDINREGMMACRHANGYDWWLLKQGSYDSNVIYKILVTADTVLVKDTQVFAKPIFGVRDTYGQSCFSSNGKKYAYSMGRTGQLFLADFDRCSGELRNPKVINIPIDSTTDPFDALQGRLDSNLTGVCFSPNDSFIYINRRFNIYQYEVYNSDSATAWYRVKHGEDTTLLSFEYYGHMLRGVDSKIYIGKAGGSDCNSNSVIDEPNKKGSACGFCRKCLRYNVPNNFTYSPANMPDFNLGADSSGCIPLNNYEFQITKDELEVYPNPTSTIFYIKNKKGKKKELFNMLGELLFTTTKDEIEVLKYARGIYFIKCEGVSKKVIVE